MQDIFVRFGEDVVLTEFKLKILPGEIVALQGRSGAGKSTVLNLAAGLLKPCKGSIWFGGYGAIESLPDKLKRNFRLKYVGFVFQQPIFFEDLTILENVAFPQIMQGVDRRAALKKTYELLERVGISDLALAYPNTPSGGELQRAQVARAFSTQPRLLLCDEPTGALDESNAALVRELMFEIARESDTAVLLATHDADLASACARVVHLVRASAGKPTL